MFNCEVTPSLWLPGAVCSGGECGETQAHHLLLPLPGDGGHDEAISWGYRGQCHIRLEESDGPAQSAVKVMMVATAERGGAAGAGQEDRSCCQPTTTRHGQIVEG